MGSNFARFDMWKRVYMQDSQFEKFQYYNDKFNALYEIL